MLEEWLLFAGLSLVVCLAGSRVTYYGDVLGEKWSVDRTFIGVILLSTITSLPELVTSLASVSLVDAPDLAMGNILGSNLFNLFLLPLLALLYGRSYLERASPHHVRTGAVAVVLYGLVGGTFALPSSPAPFGTSGPVSPASLLIFGVYAGGVYLLFGILRPPPEKALDAAEMYENHGERTTAILFAIYGLAVVLAGLFLTGVGERLAGVTGLGNTFFGSLFFAFVTSMPEFVVSWVALRRLDAVNLAMGNILGSCLFNLAILFPCDLITPAYGLLAAVETGHIVSLLGGMLMLGVAVAALVWRRRRPASRAFSGEMILLAGLYLGSMYLLFVLR